MPVVFGLIKMSFGVSKKGQLRFSERQEDLRLSESEQKNLINSGRLEKIQSAA